MAEKTLKKRVVAKKKPLNSGQFKKGNKEGRKSRGRDHAQKINLAAAFKSAVTLTDMKDIARKLVKEAKKGNAKAAKEVLDRCLGKPPQAINLGDADGNQLTPIQVVIQHGGVQG